MAALLSLLSPLLLAWAQAPTAGDYTQSTALDVLPADTLAVAEFSLEPWDRLRSQTRAAKILSGQKLLRTGLANADLPEGSSVESLRMALGGVRFTLAVSRESLLDGGFMLAIESVGLSAAEFDWPALLAHVGQQEVHAIRNGWMVAVPFPELGPMPSEALVSWVGDMQASRLKDQDNWQEMRKGMVTSNDLLRVSAAVWNLDTAFLSYLSSASGAQFPSEMIEAGMNAILGDANGRAGFVFASMIDGEEILERWRMDFGSPTANMLQVAGSVDELFELAANAPSQAASLSVSGISGRAIGAYIQGLFEFTKSVISSFDLDPSDADTKFMDDLVQGMVNVAECLDGQLVQYAPIEAMEVGAPTLTRIQTSGKETVQARWDELPAQLKTMVPFVVKELPGGAVSFAWEGDDFLIGDVGASWTSAPNQSSQRWEGLRRKIENFASGSQILSLGLFDKSVDGYWLSSPMVQELAAMAGVQFPTLTWTAETEKLRHASFQATRRNGRWLEAESRSTFGLLLIGFNEATLGALLDGGAAEFDESEF